jgi:two-component system chemotaxis sensor kinase CheA
VVLTRLMVVAAGRERFGVPLDQVVETARVPRERLVPIRAGQAFVLRDRAVPMLHLADLLGFETAGHAADLKILAVRSGADVVGVAVDALVDRFDAPVRPTSGLLAGMPGVLGTTLTGDGEVLMVLDLPELIG